MQEKKALLLKKESPNKIEIKEKKKKYSLFAKIYVLLIVRYDWNMSNMSSSCFIKKKSKSLR